MKAILIGLAVLVLMFTVTVVVLELSDSEVLQGSKRLKKQNRELNQKNRQLEETISLLDKKNLSLTTELIARRNQLPWVDVEELDGTKE